MRWRLLPARPHNSSDACLPTLPSHAAGGRFYMAMDLLGPNLTEARRTSLGGQAELTAAKASCPCRPAGWLAGWVDGCLSGWKG